MNSHPYVEGSFLYPFLTKSHVLIALIEGMTVIKLPDYVPRSLPKPLGCRTQYTPQKAYRRRAITRIPVCPGNRSERVEVRVVCSTPQ